ncbi:6735_t:CDS:2, partial [Racocetra fulgida]
MTPHNTIPGDGAVSHSIIYGGNFFMGGNIVFGEGNSHVENDEYEHSTTLENSNDETFMDFSNDDKAENCSKLELSQKVALELDSQFWNREESPYSFDPEDGKLINEYWNSLSVKQSLPKSEPQKPLNSDSPSTGLDVEIQKKVKKRKQPQEPLKSTKINSPSTDLNVEIQKKSKKRKPKSVISSSDEERSGKTNISSSQTTLSQDSGNTEPKKIKKTKYKKRIEKQPKVESNDLGPEISSDWERDIGDIESV